MARLRLLGGPAEEYTAIMIETEQDVERQRAEAERLRTEAKRLQTQWFTQPSPETKWAYASALQAWGEYTGQVDAINHAYKLLHGLI